MAHALDGLSHLDEENLLQLPLDNDESQSSTRNNDKRDYSPEKIPSNSSTESFKSICHEKVKHFYKYHLRNAPIYDIVVGSKYNEQEDFRREYNAEENLKDDKIPLTTYSSTVSDLFHKYKYHELKYRSQSNCNTLKETENTYSKKKFWKNMQKMEWPEPILREVAKFREHSDKDIFHESKHQEVKDKTQSGSYILNQIKLQVLKKYGNYENTSEISESLLRDLDFQSSVCAKIEESFSLPKLQTMNKGLSIFTQVQTLGTERSKLTDNELSNPKILQILDQNLLPFTEIKTNGKQLSDDTGKQIMDNAFLNHAELKSLDKAFSKFTDDGKIYKEVSNSTEIPIDDTEVSKLAEVLQIKNNEVPNFKILQTPDKYLSSFKEIPTTENEFPNLRDLSRALDKEFPNFTDVKKIHKEVPDMQRVDTEYSNLAEIQTEKENKNTFLEMCEKPEILGPEDIGSDESYYTLMNDSGPDQNEPIPYEEIVVPSEDELPTIFISDSEDEDNFGVVADDEHDALVELEFFGEVFDVYETEEIEVAAVFMADMEMPEEHHIVQVENNNYFEIGSQVQQRTENVPRVYQNVQENEETVSEEEFPSTENEDNYEVSYSDSLSYDSIDLDEEMEENEDVSHQEMGCYDQNESASGETHNFAGTDSNMIQNMLTAMRQENIELLKTGNVPDNQDQTSTPDSVPDMYVDISTSDENGSLREEDCRDCQTQDTPDGQSSENLNNYSEDQNSKDSQETNQPTDTPTAENMPGYEYVYETDEDMED